MLKMKLKRRLHERDIQRPVVERARKAGLIAIKQTPMYSNGWPDYMFINRQGRICWVEFKKPKGKLTPLQVIRHNELRRYKQDVRVIDDVIDGVRLIQELTSNALRSSRLPKESDSLSP